VRELEHRGADQAPAVVSDNLCPGEPLLQQSALLCGKRVHSRSHRRIVGIDVRREEAWLGVPPDRRVRETHCSPPWHAVLTLGNSAPRQNPKKNPKNPKNHMLAELLASFQYGSSGICGVSLTM
jgi:hypothetical protein